MRGVRLYIRESTGSAFVRLSEMDATRECRCCGQNQTTLMHNSEHRDRSRRQRSRNPCPHTEQHPSHREQQRNGWHMACQTGRRTDPACSGIAPLPSRPDPWTADSDGYRVLQMAGAQQGRGRRRRREETTGKSKVEVVGSSEVESHRVTDTWQNPLVLTVRLAWPTLPTRDRSSLSMHASPSQKRAQGPSASSGPRRSLKASGAASNSTTRSARTMDPCRAHAISLAQMGTACLCARARST
jgi:hypothetical protein